jgi:hypothetical protein
LCFFVLGKVAYFPRPLPSILHRISIIQAKLSAELSIFHVKLLTERAITNVNSIALKLRSSGALPFGFGLAWAVVGLFAFLQVHVAFGAGADRQTSYQSA